MTVLCTTCIARAIIMGLNLYVNFFFFSLFFFSLILYSVLPVIDEGPGHLYQLVSLLFVTCNIS